MNEAIAQCFTIPVLMLMIENLEFQKAEHILDGHSITNIEETLFVCHNALESKT